MSKSSYGFKYRVEVEHWERSADGDDWITGMHWKNFDILCEAMQYARIPYPSDPKGAIMSTVYNMTDSKDLIYRKDFIEGSETDYTTIPDLDYHNREYD